jgi:hypothetical protein
LSFVDLLATFQSPISLFRWKTCVVFLSNFIYVKRDQKKTFAKCQIQRCYSSMVRFRSKVLEKVDTFGMYQSRIAPRLREG